MTTSVWSKFLPTATARSTKNGFAEQLGKVVAVVRFLNFNNINSLPYLFFVHNVPPPYITRFCEDVILHKWQTMETNNNTNNINSQNRTSETKGESVSPVGSEALDIKELKEAFMRNTKDLRETLATLVRNPYVVSVLIFLLWMTFIDDDNLITSHRYSQKIEELSEEKESLLNGIEQDRREMKELKSNSETLEKFAREKYFMKKDDEVIFIIK